jgi:hypothetical protein
MSDLKNGWTAISTEYGNHRKVSATCGKVHNYLGMELDYQKRGELKINMTIYFENMINNFPVKLGKKDVLRRRQPLTAYLT